MVHLREVPCNVFKRYIVYDGMVAHISRSIGLNIHHRSRR